MILDSYIIAFAQHELQSKNIRSTLLVFLSVLSIVCFMQWLLKMVLQIRKLPPGPWGFPILGILSFIGSEKHLKFLRLSKIYGSLFSARLGQQLTVVIADYKLIREAFKKEEFTARPKTPIYSILNGFGEYLFY
jgi:26-hydroxylase